MSGFLKQKTMAYRNKLLDKNKLVIKGDRGYFKIENINSSIPKERVNLYFLYCKMTRNCLGSISETEAKEYLKLEE